MRHHVRTEVRPSLEVLLTEQMTELEHIIAEVAAGTRTPARYNDLEERALAIGPKIRDAFRRGSR